MINGQINELGGMLTVRKENVSIMKNRQSCSHQVSLHAWVQTEAHM